VELAIYLYSLPGLRTLELQLKVKVKLSLYRPKYAQRAREGSGSQNFQRGA
jgi:hypothetical protein